MIDPARRFSDRVADYVKYRPRYPQTVVDTVREVCGLTSESAIADIGSGTGFLSELFLDAGHTVVGVEPNREMREAGDRLLARYPAFRSLDACAEETTLPEASVDLAMAGQSFHWFEPVSARREWVRILKPGGWVALVWNERDLRAPLAAACDALLRQYAVTDGPVNFGGVGDEGVARFFAPADVTLRTFPHAQRFDRDGLVGRLLSISHAPLAGHPLHRPFVDGIGALFAAHAVDGRVAFDYVTRLYFGRLG